LANAVEDIYVALALRDKEFGVRDCRRKVPNDLNILVSSLLTIQESATAMAFGPSFEWQLIPRGFTPGRLDPWPEKKNTFLRNWRFQYHSARLKPRIARMNTDFQNQYC
jgi:hypothetical protein